MQKMDRARERSGERKPRVTAQDPGEGQESENKDTWGHYSKGGMATSDLLGRPKTSAGGGGRGDGQGDARGRGGGLGLLSPAAHTGGLSDPHRVLAAQPHPRACMMCLHALGVARPESHAQFPVAGVLLRPSHPAAGPWERSEVPG